MGVRRTAQFVDSAMALNGCDPIADCSPGLLERFGSPRAGFVVFFDSGVSALSETAHETIRSALKYATRPDATIVALEGHTSAAFSKDGTMVVTFNKICDPRTGLPAGTHPTFRGFGRRLALSPDGQYVTDGMGFEMSTKFGPATILPKPPSNENMVHTTEEMACGPTSCHSWMPCAGMA